MISAIATDSDDVVDFHLGMDFAACRTLLSRAHFLDVFGGQAAGGSHFRATVGPPSQGDGFNSFWIRFSPLFVLCGVAFRVLFSPLPRSGPAFIDILGVFVALLTYGLLFLWILAARLGSALFYRVSVLLAPALSVFSQLFVVLVAVPALIITVSLRVSLRPFGRSLSRCNDVAGVLCCSLFVAAFSALSHARFALAIDNAPRRDVPTQAWFPGKIAGFAAFNRLASRGFIHKLTLPDDRLKCNNYVVA